MDYEKETFFMTSIMYLPYYGHSILKIFNSSYVQKSLVFLKVMILHLHFILQLVPVVPRS